MEVGDKRYTVIKYDCLDRRINLIMACAATTFSLGVIAFVFTPLAEGIATILILVFVTWMALFILYNLCGVIFRARLYNKTDY